jgi:hypothetical protein
MRAAQRSARLSYVTIFVNAVQSGEFYWGKCALSSLYWMMAYSNSRNRYHSGPVIEAASEPEGPESEGKLVEIQSMKAIFFTVLYSANAATTAHWNWLSVPLYWHYCTLILIWIWRSRESDPGQQSTR